MLTLNDIVAAYFTAQAGKPSLPQMQSVWTRVQPIANYGRSPIGKAVVTRLDGSKLLKWFSRVQECMPVTTANLVAKVLSAAMHAAQKRGDLPQGPLPCSLLPRYQSAPKNGAIPLALLPKLVCELHHGYGQAFGKNADETRRLRLPYLAIALYLFTAARAEELRSVRLKDVVELDGVPGLMLERTKNGLPHFLALAPQALEIVNEIIEHHPHKAANAYLLQPTKDVQRAVSADTIARAWAKVQADLGLDGLTLHDLRRTASSALATGGESVEAVDQYLNHQKLNRVQRCYYQPQVQRLYDIACRLEQLYRQPPKASEAKTRCRSLVFGAA